MITIGSGAHVWLAQPDATCVSDTSLDTDILSSEERQRASRFVFDHDRRLYLFAHHFLRVTLSRYLNELPSALRFITTAYGRPELDCDGSRSILRFSLSHTDGLVACVVTDNIDCGVDAECVDVRVDCDQLAPKVLALSEAEELARVPRERARARFFEIWTLKEAYVKARGLGLALPIRKVVFYGFGPEPRCRFDTGLDDDPFRWRFWSGQPTPQHYCAVALRTDGVPGGLDVFEASPDLRSFWSRTLLSSEPSVARSARGTPEL